jgi:predicted DNA binding protein
MTVSTTELLELLAKAGELDLSIFVREDEDGDYIVKFYELYTNNFEEHTTITTEGENDWCVSGCSFDYLMDTFVDMLSGKEQEKIKEQKRKEVLNKLTDEELELLGVVK